MLWRRGGRTWRAKGYSHTTAADAIEEKFGASRGLGRSRIAVLVTTKKEELPPDVAAFILDELPVLNAEKWADYLRETANEPFDAPSAAPPPAQAPGLPRLDVDALAAAIVDKLPRQPDAHALADALAAKLPTLDADEVARKVAALAPTPPDAEQVARKFAAQVPSADEVASKVAAQAPSADEVATRMLRKLAPWLGGGAVVSVLGSIVLVLVIAQWLRVLPDSHLTMNVGTRAIIGLILGHGGPSNSPVWLEHPSTGSELGQRQIGPPMPQSPLKGQDVAPCQGSAEAHYGACWLKTAFQAPCPLDQFEYEKGCYAPLIARPKVPLSDLAH